MLDSFIAPIKVRQDVLVPTVFHESWWLEAATAGQYKVIESICGGKVVGRLPYITHRRYGFTVCHMPPLTHFLGPAVDDGEGSSNTRFLKRLTIISDLAEQLPPMDSIKIKCHRGITDVVAFQKEGFRCTVQFTHEIYPRPVDMLWSALRNKTRNVIRRAEETHRLVENIEPEAFLKFYCHNLDVLGKECTLHAERALRLITTALERQCGRLVAALDAKGQMMAVTFCVLDKNVSYYLMSTRDPRSGNGVGSLLLWDAIKHASERGLVFDCDGLSEKGSILFLAGFGAVLTPRYVVSRESLPIRVAHAFNIVPGERGSFY